MLEFSACYKDTFFWEISAIIRPEKIKLKEILSLKFTFDNTDLNVSTIDGFGASRAMVYRSLLPMIPYVPGSI